MINFHCTIIPVVVLETHTSAWFLDWEIHQLVVVVIDPYSIFKFSIFKYSSISYCNDSYFPTLFLLQILHGYYQA